MADFSLAIPKVLLREGGAKVTNDPADPGGVTKYGISKRAHPTLDIPNLTEAQAKAIYKQQYWDSVRGDTITDQTSAELLFDAAVNMGSTRAIALAATALGCENKLEHVLASLGRQPAKLFQQLFTLARIAYYTELCERRPASRKFFFGWIRRAFEAAT